MSLPPDREDCPVDLRYPEPGPLPLDPAVIIRRARWVRRWRHLGRASAGIVACLAAVAGVAAVRASPVAGPAPRPTASSPVSPLAPFLTTHPPANGSPTLLSTWPRHWTTVIWATGRGAVCLATFRIPMLAGTEQAMCPGWQPGVVPGEGGAGLSPLLPGVFPSEPGVTSPRPGGGRLLPWFGLVTGRAAMVSLTFLGHGYRAPVVPVPVRGTRAGAFVVWVAAPAGSSGYASRDFTGGVAYGADGQVVARHGPWP